MTNPEITNTILKLLPEYNISEIDIKESYTNGILSNIEITIWEEVKDAIIGDIVESFSMNVRPRYHELEIICKAIQYNAERDYNPEDEVDISEIIEDLEKELKN